MGGRLPLVLGSGTFMGSTRSWDFHGWEGWVNILCFLGFSEHKILSHP